MIVFDLKCSAGGHRFEGWFGSSDDYTSQQERGLVSCPECGSTDVSKAPMAAQLARKGNQRSTAPSIVPQAPVPPSGMQQMMSNGGLSPDAAAKLKALAEMQAKALANSRWVGEEFAEQARKMHYGESEVEAIHGQASLQEAQDLNEEGIGVAPLLFPVAPPGETH